MLFGRGVCAEMEPLLMMRPPRGSWAFIIRTACWAHRKTPVRLVSTTRCQSARSISSAWAAGPNRPALFTSRSSRPQRSFTASNSAATDAGSVTSAGTARAVPLWAPSAVSFSSSARRPASATCQPAPSRACAMTRPRPELAPVTMATLMLLSSPLADTRPTGRSSIYCITALRNYGDRPPAGLDQPHRQRPDPAVPGLHGGTHDDGVGAHFVGHPPQFGVRIAVRDHERERHAEPLRSRLGFLAQAYGRLLERLLLRGDRARPGPRRRPVHGRRPLDVDADQPGPLPPGQPGRVRPGPHRGDRIVHPDQDHLGPVGAQFEGSAFRVRHSGIIGTNPRPLPRTLAHGGPAPE